MRETPYVVGVTGGTCSGKSTLSDRLELGLKDKYRVVVLHMDKYFKRPTPTTIAPISRIEYMEHNHPESFHLDAFYADFEAAANDNSESRPELVIVEGLFPFYLDRIRERLDLKVFVDLKSDERIVRRIKKHMQWGQTMDEVTNRYLDTVRFRHDELIEPMRWHADLVVNGTLDMHRGAEVLLHYIECQL